MKYALLLLALHGQHQEERQGSHPARVSLQPIFNQLQPPVTKPSFAYLLAVSSGDRDVATGLLHCVGFQAQQFMSSMG